MSRAVRYLASCIESQTQHLRVQIEVSGPFTSSVVEFSFPRWVPGSYLIRDPLGWMVDLEALDRDGGALRCSRLKANRVQVRIPRGSVGDASFVLRVRYRLLCTTLSVRSNHLDSTHLHLMPPFTWMLIEKGIEMTRLDAGYDVLLAHDANWESVSQLEDRECEPAFDPDAFLDGAGKWSSWHAPDIDELLDGIIESNPNPLKTFEVQGRTHHLKLWDAGGHTIDWKGVDLFIEAASKIIAEHYALFGVPPWDDYVTILHLTEGPRGGLEHLRSQTSMVPRRALEPLQKEAWRNLVSLFSHEFLHQWNVKRLRPRCFLEYDLDAEVHTDLLWWFEGLTSWLGDVLCWRCGAWSDEDWLADMERKLNRHHSGNGCNHQSLADSSHEAWIHLYRPHPHMRESQISYYLEGELAVFCADAEMRRRSKGAAGMDDLLLLLWETHGIDRVEGDDRGIDWRRISAGLRTLPGGSRLSAYLDRLVNTPMPPPLADAASTYGLKLEPSKKRSNEHQGWLGLTFVDEGLNIRSVAAASPCRAVLRPGDELIAVDGLRVKNAAQLKQLLIGRDSSSVELLFSRHGALDEEKVEVEAIPRHSVRLTGKGNRLWKLMRASRQDSASDQ